MLWFMGIVGILLFVLGRWGLRQGAELIPAALTAAEKERRVRVYRRGAIVLQCIGVVFVVFALAGVVHLVSRS